MSHQLFRWPPRRFLWTEKPCDFIQHCYSISFCLLSLLSSLTQKSLAIHTVALSCRVMCNGKDKWRIKLRWQDWACMCFVSVCVRACLRVCTSQQTSKPSAHLLLMNKANSRSQGCLQIWSLLLVSTHKHTQIHTHSLRCLIWLSLIENRGRATFLDLTPTSVTEKVWNTISKLFLNSALQSHLTTGNQANGWELTNGN